MAEPSKGIVPYFVVDDGKRAAQFYKDVFGATESFKRENDKGGIAHMTMQIPSGTIMVSDDPQWGRWAHLPRSPYAAIGWLAIYVEDVDVVFKSAIAAGATTDLQPENTPWGDRYARFRDPFGQVWALSGPQPAQAPSGSDPGSSWTGDSI